MITQEKIAYSADEIKSMIKTCEKYNKARDMAKKIYNSEFEPDVAAVLAKYLPMLFPELKESKDERIRKTIYGWIYTQPSEFFDDGFSKEEMLDWVEKQGEKKPNSQMEKCGKCQFNFTGYCDGTCILENNDQKPVDKIEPKFKPGDWVSNGRYVKKIIDINNDWPYYIFQDGSSYRIKEVDAKWHIIPNVDELKWVDMETRECHCYNCELFDRKNNMCKCSTLCKEYHNTYKGFYIKIKL